MRLRRAHPDVEVSSEHGDERLASARDPTRRAHARDRRAGPGGTPRRPRRARRSRRARGAPAAAPAPPATHACRSVGERAEERRDLRRRRIHSSGHLSTTTGPERCFFHHRSKRSLKCSEAPRDPARDRARRQIERLADRAIALVPGEEAVEDLAALAREPAESTRGLRAPRPGLRSSLVGDLLARSRRPGRLRLAERSTSRQRPPGQLAEPRSDRLVANAAEPSRLVDAREDVLENVLGVVVGQPERLRRDRRRRIGRSARRARPMPAWSPLRQRAVSAPSLSLSPMSGMVTGVLAHVKAALPSRAAVPTIEATRGTERRRFTMSLQIGATAPDFEATPPTAVLGSTSGSAILGCALLAPEGLHARCARPSSATWPSSNPTSRSANVKVIGLSVDPVATTRWPSDIKETQGHAPNYPMIGDTELEVAKLYGMLPADEAGDSDGRTAAETRRCERSSSWAPTRRSSRFCLPDDARGGTSTRCSG